MPLTHLASFTSYKASQDKGSQSNFTCTMRRRTWTSTGGGTISSLHPLSSGSWHPLRKQVLTVSAMSSWRVWARFPSAISAAQSPSWTWNQLLPQPNQKVRTPSCFVQCHILFELGSRKHACIRFSSATFVGPPWMWNQLPPLPNLKVWIADRTV